MVRSAAYSRQEYRSDRITDFNGAVAPVGFGALTSRLSVYGDVGYQHQVSVGGFRGWAFNGGVRYSF